LPDLLQSNFQYTRTNAHVVPVTLYNVQENEIWSEEGPWMEVTVKLQATVALS